MQVGVGGGGGIGVVVPVDQVGGLPVHVAVGEHHVVGAEVVEGDFVPRQLLKGGIKGGGRVGPGVHLAAVGQDVLLHPIGHVGPKVALVGVDGVANGFSDLESTGGGGDLHMDAVGLLVIGCLLVEGVGQGAQVFLLLRQAGDGIGVIGGRVGERWHGHEGPSSVVCRACCPAVVSAFYYKGTGGKGQGRGHENHKFLEWDGGILRKAPKLGPGRKKWGRPLALWRAIV